MSRRWRAAFGPALLAAVGVPAVTAAAPAGEDAELRGTVANYTLTPKGDVDGFVFSDGREVHLPPHLSTALVFTARPGDAVTVRGRRDGRSPVVEAAEVRNESSGVSLASEGPKGKHAADAGGPVRIDGKVRFTLHGPKGEPNGAMLEDGTVLRLPPDEAEEVADRLAPGRTITAEGPARTTPMGRVVEVKKLD